MCLSVVQPVLEGIAPDGLVPCACSGDVHSSMGRPPRRGSTGNFEDVGASHAPELLTAVSFAKQQSVVYSAGWALPRHRGVKQVPILAAVGRLPRVASLPRMLGPEHFAAAIRTWR
jgi:hypothetical protein